MKPDQLAEVKESLDGHLLTVSLSPSFNEARITIRPRSHQVNVDLFCIDVSHFEFQGVEVRGDDQEALPIIVGGEVSFDEADAHRNRTKIVLELNPGGSSEAEWLLIHCQEAMLTLDTVESHG
jgi:hypothetical protein